MVKIIRGCDYLCIQEIPGRRPPQFRAAFFATHHNGSFRYDLLCKSRRVRDCEKPSSLIKPPQLVAGVFKSTKNDALFWHEAKTGRCNCKHLFSEFYWSWCMSECVRVCNGVRKHGDLAWSASETPSQYVPYLFTCNNTVQGFLNERTTTIFRLRIVAMIATCKGTAFKSRKERRVMRSH